MMTVDKSASVNNPALSHTACSANVEICSASLGSVSMAYLYIHISVLCALSFVLN